MKLKPSRSYAIILCLALSGVIACWLLYPVYLQSIFPQKYSDLEPGTYGDMFGGLNALLTGLAFALLIYTTLLQRKELQLQREELLETRKEFSQQTKIHSEHLKLLRLERETREKEKEAMNAPRFILRFNKHNGRSTQLLLANGGAPIYDLEIIQPYPDGATKINLDKNTILDRHSHTFINYFHEKQMGDFIGKYEINIAFTDVMNNRLQASLFIERG